ncbi:MAG: c-type cytochrome [Bacteroidota bacterium]
MVLRNKWIWSLLTIICCIVVMAFKPVSKLKKWDAETPIHEVLFALGEEKPKHFLKKMTPEMVERGKEIILTGQTTSPKGKKSSRVSKYYQCTTCHNLVQEDPDLTKRDPELRLDYAIKNKLPFLQATTFHGIVNRESWYNDDYVKKYGDLVRKANQSLEESIQLCATECAQGRLLKGWELEAVTAYFWSLGFKLGELGLTDQEMGQLVEGNEAADPEELRAMLKSKYMLKSPAHFGDAPPNKEKGYEGLTGNPERGKHIYELSCQYCHKEGGVSWYTLDDNKLTFKELLRNIPKEKHFSLYQIIRYGTYAVPGHRPYMPHYPIERMSNQQVEDLRSYIVQEAK